MSTSRARAKQVKFWASEKELEQIKKKVKKSKLTQSEYLLRSALDKNILVVDGLKDILIELSREGNNLNQITKALNQGDRIEVYKILEAKEKLMDLWDHIGVASGKCEFHTLRAFSPLIPMVCRLFRYSKVYIVL